MKNQILEQVLRAVSPSKREEKAVRKLAREIEETLEKYLPAGTTITLAGSVVKGTFLRGRGDIDLFVLFPFSYTKEEMFEKVKKAAAKAFPRIRKEISYAEHPYLRVHFQGKKADIVPAYFMREGEHIRSSVDRSQLHTKYVLSHIDDEKKGEVRLLKRFLATNGLYGAEIKILGFSGYLCELLILQYGDFLSTLNSASVWRLPVFIDPMHHYLSRTTGLDRFPDSTFIVVDPVDSTRNVAAAVSEENLAKFMLLGREFLNRPATSFFKDKPVLSRQKLTSLVERRNVFTISMEPPKVVEDVLWGQLRKFSHSFSSFLEEQGFTVLSTQPRISGKRALVIFEVAEEELPRNRLVQGPSVFMGPDCSRFFSFHKKSAFFVRKSRVYAYEKRKIRTVEAAYSAFRSRHAEHFPSKIKNSAKHAKLLSGKLLLRYPKPLSDYFQSF